MPISEKARRNALVSTKRRHHQRVLRELEFERNQHASIQPSRAIWLSAEAFVDDWQYVENGEAEDIMDEIDRNGFVWAKSVTELHQKAFPLGELEAHIEKASKNEKRMMKVRSEVARGISARAKVKYFHYPEPNRMYL